MKTPLRKTTGAVRNHGVAWIAALVAAPWLAQAQTYSINWATIDGGGGTSAGGVYSLSGTIGQPVAGKQTGDGYTLEGGLWSLVAAVQKLLSVTTSNGSATISWPLPAAGFVLDQSPHADWHSAALEPSRGSLPNQRHAHPHHRAVSRRVSVLSSAQTLALRAGVFDI